MPFAKWWKYGIKALKETSNLVSLTILVIAFLLTVDWVLLCIGGAVELAYLSWASFLPYYRTRLEPQTQSSKRVVDFLDRVLLVVTVAGVVVILFFGFGKHLLSHPWPYLTHAEGWEAGAIVWTGLFLLYYIAKFRSTSNRGVDSFIIILFAVVSTFLLNRAWGSMRRPLEHVIYIWLIGACFFVIDLLIVKFHPEPKERNLSRNSLVWADIPMVVAFPVLLAYLWVHRDTEYPDVFVSGVVSCQLLISNAVFVVMEFGLLQPPRR